MGKKKKTNVEEPLYTTISQDSNEFGIIQEPAPIPTVEYNQPHGRNQRSSVSVWNSLFKRAANNSILRSNGTFNVTLNWNWLLLHFMAMSSDVFQWLITRSWLALIIILVCGYITALLSYTIALYTFGPIHECIATAKTFSETYYFVVETMFAIGYGSPRYPNCSLANILVTPIVITGCFLNAVTFGALFHKFMSSSNHENAIAFSSRVLARNKYENGEQVHQLTFRMMNTSKHKFSRPSMDAFIVSTDTYGKLRAKKIQKLELSVPLELLSTPVEATFSGSDQGLEGIDLESTEAELLVILTSTTETTSRISEVRKTWSLKDDITWGSNFKQIIFPNLEGGGWVVNVGDLSATDEVV
eukprot:Filipodium_phascolosomae@DN2572_c0_g1_i10.p1